VIAVLAGRVLHSGVPVADPWRLPQWWSAAGPILASFSVLRTLLIAGGACCAALGLSTVSLSMVSFRPAAVGRKPVNRVARRVPGIGPVAARLAGCTIAGATVVAGPAPATPAGAAATGLVGAGSSGADGNNGGAPEPAPPGSTAGPVPPRLIPLDAPGKVRRTPASVTTPSTPPSSPEEAPPATPASPPPPPPPPPPRPAPPATPSASVPSPGTPQSWSSTGSDRGSAWRVKAGDSLWSIAESVVAERLARQPTDSETGRYWLRLIAANRDRLPDPGNPSLIFAGDSIALPPG
jgi:hypothetical protein